MGGAPRNPVPKNHLLFARSVKPSGCHCADRWAHDRQSFHSGNVAECRPPLGARSPSPSPARPARRPCPA